MAKSKPSTMSGFSDARPAKRTKLLSDAESSDGDGDDDSPNGVALPEQSAAGFQINEEYAKRFEHNMKRAEMHQLEEKYKNTMAGGADSDDSTSEEEDDDAELATRDLDDEIFATLNAIKSKDPSVYNKDVTFYRSFDPDADPDAAAAVKKEKPMYLRDYHRQNLLDGLEHGGMQVDEPPQTYAQEQETLKDSVVRQMHATADDNDGAQQSDEDGFLVKKKKSIHERLPTAAPVKTRKPAAPDVAAADRDPETFLSNFMAARAWLPGESSRFEAFDSDDSEEEKRAEGYEAAYNMRFENPQGANEKLVSFGRDVAKYSARREELSGRKKQREKERAIKDEARRERAEEKARLRKLKIDEVEEKVKRIREAAGLHAKDTLDLKDWSNVLEEDWDDDRWEEEMKKRFGDAYYEQQDRGLESDEDTTSESNKAKAKAKKPKWNDDIDIKDLVPDFVDDDATNPPFTLTDDEEPDEVEGKQDDNDDDDNNDEVAAADSSSKPSKRTHQTARADAKRASRKQRRAIEDIVDTQLSTTPSTTTGQPSAFRYRATSPTSFGLSARDILFADDAALNAYAGLRKMAAFRDEEKKRKDRKRLGKKARLRQWRRETFGDDEGFRGGFKEFLGEGQEGGDAEGAGAGKKEGAGEDGATKRKRRSKKRKAGGE